MGVATAYHETTGLVNQHPSSMKNSQSSSSKVTVHKARRPQHRLPLIKRRPRLVRFNLEANKVQETKRTCSPESKSTMFWTRDERDDILEANQRLAMEYRREEPINVEKANQVFHQCCHDQDIYQDSSSEDDDYLYEEDEDEDDDESLDQVERDECFVASRNIDVPPQMRGLEWSFLPASKKYRRTHVQRVLRWQQRLEGGTSAKKSHALSLRAVRSSRPSRVLARILADSDARSAKDIPVVRRARCRMLPSWW